MRPTNNDQALLKNGALVRYLTLDHFREAFGERPRRLQEQHFTYVLIAVKQGRGQCSVDTESVDLAKGSLLLVNPFSFLHLENVMYCQGIVILFTEEFLCRTSLQEQMLYKIIYMPNRKLVFQLMEDEVGFSYIQSQLSMFAWEYRLGKDALLKFDFLHTILMGAMIYLHKVQLEAENALADYSEPIAKSQLVAFLQLLNRHFREESSLQFYADKMSITLDQLALVCKKGIGWTPKAIMQEKLLRESKRLLLFEVTSVKEISYILGFTEPTNFVKFFQQHTGVSPKSFRIQHCVAGLEGEG